MLRSKIERVKVLLKEGSTDAELEAYVNSSLRIPNPQLVESIIRTAKFEIELDKAK